MLHKEDTAKITKENVKIDLENDEAVPRRREGAFEAPDDQGQPVGDSESPRLAEEPQRSIERAIKEIHLNPIEEQASRGRLVEPEVEVEVIEPVPAKHQEVEEEVLEVEHVADSPGLESDDEIPKLQPLDPLYSNPFFLEERDISDLCAQYGVSRNEFNHFTRQFVGLLKLSNHGDRCSEWELLQEELDERFQNFVRDFRRKLLTMIEFGAQRNISLYRENKRKLPKQGIPLKDENHCVLEGHWGNYHVKIIDGKKCVIKIINLKRVWKKDELIVENPYTEIDYHRILYSMCSEFFPEFVDILVENHVALYYMECGNCTFDYVNRQHRKGLIVERTKFRKFEAFMRSLFLDYLRALQFMHSCGFTHGDVKLENMIFVQVGEDAYKAKFIDLGTCRKHEAGENGEYDFTIDILMHSGTDFNMSPERRFHFNSRDAERFKIHMESTGEYNSGADDLWAWGCSLIIALVGGHVWELKSFKGKFRERPTAADFAMFAIASGGTYLNDDKFIKKWFRRRELNLTLRELFIQRDCGHFISDECLDMLATIFRPEADRSCIEEVLEHPWFSMQL